MPNDVPRLTNNGYPCCVECGCRLTGRAFGITFTLPAEIVGRKKGESDQLLWCGNVCLEISVLRTNGWQERAAELKAFQAETRKVTGLRAG